MGLDWKSNQIENYICRQVSNTLK